MTFPPSCNCSVALKPLVPMLFMVFNTVPWLWLGNMSLFCVCIGFFMRALPWVFEKDIASLQEIDIYYC